eukprot:TRINITY_DN731_c3_g1_i1.p1 TRINITY_DN731_c3_g1~~TRINITY_DN731_c3_g1_i1.p1  ORF type:complete len:364 (+),score=22.43 TRINITY_DN731_c3_g1_i1:73-1164(+)
MPGNMAPLGTLGSIILEDTYTFTRHRLGWFFLTCFLISVISTTLRVHVKSLREKYPLQVKHTKKDVAALWIIMAVSSAIYLGKVSNSDPRFPENHLLKYRLSYYLAIFAVYTAVFYAAKKKIVSGLPVEQQDAQAANVVRVIVKLTCFGFWALSGDFSKVVALHPLQLTDEIYTSSYWCIYGVTSLYIWEILFRGMQPVNIAHHAIACMGAGAVFEWQSVIEPCRTITSMALMASCIEGFCCLGTMCYRFLPKGALLKRIMTAEFIFVVVAYNLLLLAYLSVLIGYNDLFSVGWGYVCMPCLTLFTYPAQMNMAKIFWDLRKKAGGVPSQASKRQGEGFKTACSVDQMRVVDGNRRTGRYLRE